MFVSTIGLKRCAHAKVRPGAHSETCDTCIQRPQHMPARTLRAQCGPQIIPSFGVSPFRISLPRSSPKQPAQLTRDNIAAANKFSTSSTSLYCISGRGSLGDNLGASSPCPNKHNCARNRSLIAYGRPTLVFQVEKSDFKRIY